MLNKGVPKEVLQTLLGHRSIKTTEIYARKIFRFKSTFFNIAVGLQPTMAKFVDA